MCECNPNGTDKDIGQRREGMLDEEWYVEEYHDEDRATV